MGLRCLTVRISDRQVRRLISNGYLSLESSEEAQVSLVGVETPADVSSKSGVCDCEQHERKADGKNDGG